jgi:hypothetical protein
VDKFEYMGCIYEVVNKKLKTPKRYEDVPLEKMEEMQTSFGAEGWELVAAVPLVEGSVSKMFSSNQASYTTSVHYWFKRRV